MFLVMMRYLNDDLPVVLFTTREAADKFVADIDNCNMEQITKVFNLDVSSPICVVIVELSDSITYHDGCWIPVKMDMVRDFCAEEYRANNP